MGVLELKEDIPDLFDRIDDILKQNSLLEQKAYIFEAFHKSGVFLDNDDLGTLKGVLGYDSRYNVRLIYTLSDKEEVIGKPEMVFIPKNRFYEVLDANFDISERKKGYFGRTILTEDKPIIVDAVIKTDLDNIPTHNELPLTELNTENMEELSSILDSLGLKKISDYRELDFGSVLKIVEWFREGMEYDSEFTRSNNLDSCFVNRKGICEQFSDIFSQMVKAAGGSATGIMGKVLNLHWRGRNAYQSKYPINDHAVSRVWYDNRWNIVDPTMYQAGCETGVAGEELRAFNPLHNSNIIVNPDTLSIKLINRLSPSGKKGNLFDLLSNLGKERYANPIIYPKVDVQSIEVLK